MEQSYKSIPVWEIAEKFLLEKDGKNYHCFNIENHKNNDKHPSLSISEKGFHCFACGVKGNGVELVKQCLKINTAEAIKWINNEFSIAEPLVKERKRHVRYLSHTMGKKYEFVQEKDIKFNKPTDSDCEKILKLSKKKFSRSTLEKAGVFIFDQNSSYGLIFWEANQKIYNPKKKTVYLHVEGRPDYLTLIELCLNDDFGLVSDFNKTATIRIDYGKHFFLMDADVTPEIIKGRIQNTTSVEIRFIRLPEGFKDISEWYNSENFAIQELKTLIEKSPSEYIPPKSLSIGIDFNFSDIALSEIFSQTWNGLIKYDYNSGKWVIWNGTQWLYDVKGNITESAKLTIQLIKKSILDKGDKKLTAKALQLETRYKIENMLKLSQSLTSIAVLSDDFDNMPHILNCRNGEYDLKNNEFISHNPGHLQTKVSGTSYDESATCPAWIDFLNVVFDSSEEKISFVQRALGYSLSGVISEEVLFFAYGTGKNGKSIFFTCLSEIFGDYAQKAPIELLLQKQSEGIRNDIARLKGSRLVVTAEVPENRFLNEEKLKDLTGGDRITARFLFKEFFEFEPTHTLWIFGNHKPNVRGLDEGIWRRLLLIPFTVKIPDEKRRPRNEILDELLNESPGILNWLIEGWKEYQCNGLNPPTEITAATTEYRQEQDLLSDFLHDCCIEEVGANTLLKDVYGVYSKWCADNRDTPLKNREFYKKMADKGYQTVILSRGNYKGYANLKLNPDYTNSLKFENSGDG